MRICFWAGAGAGKSSLTPSIVGELKKRQFKVELVDEYIKNWAYEGRTPKSYDQVYIFAKQLHKEDVYIRNGIDHIVTDSPILMQTFYSRKYNFQDWESLYKIGKSFEEKHPSINIFLDRTGIPYSPHGRYETEEQAKQIDSEMEDYLEKYVGDYVIFKTLEQDKILEHILSVIK